jgi:CBS domain-containing protein
MPHSHTLPTAREIMTTRLVTVRPELPIFDAIRTLLKNQISGAPVVDEGGALVGMLSEVDCLKVLANGEFYDDDRSEKGIVSNYMTSVTQSIDPETDVYTVAQYFLKHTVRRLPVVVRGSILLGQISRRDVLRAIEEIGRKRMPRKRFPDYREPMDRSDRTAHLHHR